MATVLEDEDFLDDDILDDYDDDDIFPSSLDDEDELICDHCGGETTEVLCPTCTKAMAAENHFNEPLDPSEREFVRWLTDRGVQWMDANSFLRSVAQYIDGGVDPSHLP